MRIHLGTDHAGFEFKELLSRHLSQAGHDVVDHGALEYDALDDYPAFCAAAAAAVVAERSQGVEALGVVIGGSGNGEQIAANKVPGIRAAVIHDTYVARQGVEHDDVNVACLGAWVVGERIATDAVEAFLAARFSSDADFRRRVAQLAEMDGSAATSELTTSRDG